jgi:hypothetical protein
VKKELKLSGGEISMLKALGLGGSATHGKLFIDRMDDLEPAEFLDTLSGLIMMGYVLSTKINVSRLEEVEHSSFRVNASYARDLRDAIRPSGRRDEEREKRRRRG